MHRLFDGAGFAGVLVLSLLYARLHAVDVARRLADRTWNAKLYATIVQGQYPADEKCGITQFYAFVVTLAIVSLGALAFGAFRAVLARWRPARLAGPAIDVLFALIALWRAHQVARPTGAIALGVIVLVGLSVAAYCGRGGPVSRPASDRVRAGIVILAEAAAVLWMAWIFGREHVGWIYVAPLGILLSAVVGRIASARDVLSLETDALAGAPLLFLPFVGLRRDPSLLWVCGALFATIVLRLVLAPRRLRLPEWMASTVAPTSFAAILVLPLRFRELPNASHMNHEGQHLAWLMSAIHGKLLFADAGFIYGPAREYLLGLIAWALGGIRLDHVRLAHVFLNLAGVATLSLVGWRLVRRRPWLFALWWWLILARTPAWFFLDYPSQISFGWADDARAAFALLAMVLAFEACDRLQSIPASARALRPLAVAGLLAGFALFYSQDCGVACIAATSVCLGADALLRRRALSLRERLARAVRTVGAFTAGATAVVVTFILFYVAMGRGHALVEFLRYEAVLGAGMSGATPGPLTADDALHPASLVANAEYYVPIFTVLVGAVAAVAAVLRSGWSARVNVVAGLTLFSSALFRYGLMRADPWHIIASAIPAYLLLVVLVSDATRFAPVWSFGGRLRLPLGAFLAVGVVALSMWNLDRDVGLNARANRIASSEERPSKGDRYFYPDVPRAGDAHVSDDTLAIVRYVRANTNARDPIWVVFQIITGGEIYFLSDRVDATPFDLYSEVVTTHDVERVMQSLRQTPPALIVGARYDYTPEVSAYVEAHWKYVTTLGGNPIRRYDPASF